MLKKTNHFNKIKSLLNREEKYKIIGIVFLMFIASGLELLGVGVIFPFVQLVNQPEIVYSHPRYSWAYHFVNASSPNSFIVFIGLGIIIFYVCKTIFFIFFQRTQIFFVRDKQVQLEKKLMNLYLYSPYTFHLQRNTSENLRNIQLVNAVTEGYILTWLNLFVEGIIIVSILTFLIFFQPWATLGVFLLIGSSTSIFYHSIKRKLSLSGKIQAEEAQLKQLWFNQAFGSIKEIKVLNKEEFFIKKYAKACFNYAEALYNYRFWGQLPRLFFELLVVCSMILLVLLMMFLAQNIESLVPTLALMVVAAVRILPSVNRLVAMVMKLRQSAYAVNLVFDDLVSLERNKSDTPLSLKELPLKRNIEIIDLEYVYPGTDTPALTGLSLSIPKGSSVAFVGPSGAGKTTLVNVILGLLHPSGGKILVDGIDIQENITAWQQEIGYIPQDIYLIDDSVRRNIALGVEDHLIDDDQVWRAVQLAQLEDFIKSLPKGLDTKVGEQGVRISGGQRQRIGIGRALYHNPKVLVFDEATSALDSETEQKVGQSIKQLTGKKTLIIIAHRLSTVMNCDQIFFLQNGRLEDQGSFQELMENNDAFKELCAIAFCDPSVESGEKC